MSSRKRPRHAEGLLRLLARGLPGGWHQADGRAELAKRADRTIKAPAAQVGDLINHRDAIGMNSLADPQRSVGNIHPLWTYAHVPNGFSGDATKMIIAQIERFASAFTATGSWG